MRLWKPIAGLARKLRGKPVHFLYGNLWHWLAGVMERIQPRLGPAGFSDNQQNFSAFDQILHAGVDRKELSRKRFAREKKDGGSFPASYVLMDHTGKIVYAGPLTKEELEGWLARLLKKVPPGYLDIGGKLFEKLGALAAQVRDKRNLGRAVRALEAQKTEGEGKQAEARRLLAVIQGYVKAKEASVQKALAKDPEVARSRLGSLAAEFEGCDLHKELAAKMKALAGSATFEAAGRLQQIRTDLAKIKACDKCTRLGCGFACLSCDTCREDRETSIQQLRSRVQKLLEESKGLGIEDAVRQLLATMI